MHRAAFLRCTSQPPVLLLRRDSVQPWGGQRLRRWRLQTGGKRYAGAAIEDHRTRNAMAAVVPGVALLRRAAGEPVLLLDRVGVLARGDRRLLRPHLPPGQPRDTWADRRDNTSRSGLALIYAHSEQKRDRRCAVPFYS